MLTFHHFVVFTMMIVFSYMGVRMFRRAVASQELQVNARTATHSDRSVRAVHRQAVPFALAAPHFPNRSTLTPHICRNGRHRAPRALTAP